VELISAVQTSKDTLDRSRAFAEACGKGIRLSFVAFWAVAYIYAHRGGYIAGRARLCVERTPYAVYQ